jgi:hypothetical protein
MGWIGAAFLENLEIRIKTFATEKISVNMETE